ncbi:Hypothetical predicted protein [Octopus vulgaris]|uniref:Uncharacterized protein n=1 Tax=Octopus vulgaris TaxID=6645 RepID=A0AA36C136_OCTVU|nr:Hypothetical predicted protein [Octopus vulgaris]
MERPVEWKCKNYTYGCNTTMCTNTNGFQVTQSGNHSTFWIGNISSECLTWTFYDNNNNFGKFDLKTNGFRKAETYEITQNDNGALNVSATLMIEIPNMQRPTVWKYNNYKYECLARRESYNITQSGLARRESYNITQSEPVALGGSVTLHIEVAEMTGIVFWKNNNGRYECNPTCYNYGNHEVTRDGSKSTLSIRMVSEQDFTWRFCDLYLCSAKYTLMTKGEETETTTTKDAETTTTKDAETTTTKDAETNGSGDSLPTYAYVLIFISVFVAIVIIVFVVIFKSKSCIKVKTSITKYISCKKG